MNGQHNTPIPGGGGGGGVQPITMVKSRTDVMCAHLAYERDRRLLHCLGVADVGLYQVLEGKLVALNSTQSRAQQWRTGHTLHVGRRKPSPSPPLLASYPRQRETVGGRKVRAAIRAGCTGSYVRLPLVLFS